MKKALPALQLLGLLIFAAALVVFLENKPSELSQDTQSMDSGQPIRARLAVDRYEQEIREHELKRPHRPYHHLRTFDEKRSSPGLTLVGVNEAGEMILLSHDGKIVKSWAIDSDRSILLPESCSLLATHGTVMGAKISPWKALRHTLREYSSDGDLLWEYDGDKLLHHDVRQISPTEFLTIEQRLVPYNGKEPLQNFEMKADSALILNRDGKEVYRWNSDEHIDHDFCGIRGCPSAPGIKISRAELKRRKDWTHVNTLSIVPENRWFEKGDTRFKPGNLLLHVRNFWMSLIVDRETKEVVWRFPEYEEFNDNPDVEIRGGHESHMIPPGLPGAGNILIFDNGSSEVRPFSRVLEIDPVERRVVWSYEDADRFFSRTAGAVQRLPNGNTLVSEDLKGRVFEVTSLGEIVWELDTPYRTARARRYPLNWCE